jgi:hypothetical protein
MRPFILSAALLAVSATAPAPKYRTSEQCGVATDCTTDTDCERKCGHLPSLRDLAQWEAAERARIEAEICRAAGPECDRARNINETSRRLNAAALEN